jgi:nucleoside-diphosphate-sugar epimerase
MADEGTGASVVVAGATGDVGGRIARALVARGARVTAIVRPGSGGAEKLRADGIAVVEVDLASVSDVANACAGAACVVSALSGVRDVIVDAQTILLDGAVAAGVPRFIPSDFSIDFTPIPVGSNRNFDLRREFHERLATRPIRATSIYNGAFADMLKGQMPLILLPIRRVLHWGDPDREMDFTTKDDTAAFTAAAALDSDAPRALHIAGDRLSARGLAAAASEARGVEFKLLQAGTPGLLAAGTLLVRAVYPAQDQVFPPWQGMQYLHNMVSGEAPLAPLDNGRYPGLTWTSVRDVLRRG